jgi:hypothetical protein
MLKFTVPLQNGPVCLSERRKAFHTFKPESTIRGAGWRAYICIEIPRFNGHTAKRSADAGRADTDDTLSSVTARAPRVALPVPVHQNKNRHRNVALAVLPAAVQAVTHRNAPNDRRLRIWRLTEP